MEIKATTEGRIVDEIRNTERVLEEVRVLLHDLEERVERVGDDDFIEAVRGIYGHLGDHERFVAQIRAMRS